jgi:ATP phosphoribosyltransferase
MSALVLAIPSKGRLQEQASAYFADCGLAIEAAGGARGYAARIEAAPDVEVRLLSASDIARAIVEGDVHVGVTGEDVLREAACGFDPPILVKALGFGRADLVVAAPMAWLDVETMADLADVCAEHRARTGKRLRVATKYIAQTRTFFEAHGIDDYRIVESLGATEGAPAAGAAEVIVDITTTGATLVANHLAPLADGLILKSQAHLAASRSASWGASALAAFAHIMDAIEARSRAKKLRLVRAMVNPARRADLDSALARLGCRPANAEDGAAAWWCPLGMVFQACAEIQQTGGSAGVFEADYLFERPNVAFEAFSASLNGA